MIPISCLFEDNVLQAMRSVPREDFLTSDVRQFAALNEPLPIDRGLTTSAPDIIYKVVKESNLDKTKTVLEVGTGSGWQTAVLAKLAKHVFTIEINPNVLKRATARFNEYQVKNITTRLGNGKYGWPDQAPFNVIIVSAALNKIPRELGKQLTDRGFMIFPLVMHGEEQQLVKMWKNGSIMNLGPVKFVKLKKEY